MNVGESKPSTLMVISQLFVVEAKQVEHGRVQIMHMNTVFLNVISKVVS